MGSPNRVVRDSDVTVNTKPVDDPTAPCCINYYITTANVTLALLRRPFTFAVKLKSLNNVSNIL